MRHGTGPDRGPLDDHVVGAAELVEAKQDVRTEGSRRNRRIVTTYCPVYEFTVNGQTQRVTALGDDCRESREAVTLGETATILYDPADPSIAFVDSDATSDFFADSAGSSVVGIVVVAVLVLLGVLVIVQARPKTPEQLAKQAEAKARAEEELRKLNEELDGTK